MIWKLYILLITLKLTSLWLLIKTKRQLFTGIKWRHSLDVSVGSTVRFLCLLLDEKNAPPLSPIYRTHELSHVTTVWGCQSSMLLKSYIHCAFHSWIISKYIELTLHMEYSYVPFLLLRTLFSAICITPPFLSSNFLCCPIDNYHNTSPLWFSVPSDTF